MKEPQRGFEVGHARIARRNDGDAAAELVLQCRDEQRACFDGCAGDIEAAVAIEELPKKRRLGDARAKIGNQGVVAVVAFQVARILCSRSYGVKYPLIVRAVSFGELTTTRNGRHSFVLPKSETWYLIAN
jgi:hypothetical protein